MNTPPDPPSPADEDGDYYAAIERRFVELRGGPLFITPQDWQLIHHWHEMQIPLGVVKAGLERAFEKRKRRAVRRLAYCRQTVEASFRRHCEALAGSVRKGETGEEDVRVQDYLRTLGGRLREAGERCRARRPMLAETARRGADRVESMAEHTVHSGSFEEIETELDRMDEELVRVAEASLDEHERRCCREEATESLADYRARMPEDVYASALENAYRRRVRSHLGLPALSLYYL